MPFASRCILYDLSLYLILRKLLIIVAMFIVQFSYLILHTCQDNRMPAMGILLGICWRRPSRFRVTRAVDLFAIFEQSLFLLGFKVRIDKLREDFLVNFV